MKKFLALALSCLMCLSLLTACGGDEEVVEDEEYEEEEVLEEEEIEETPLTEDTAIELASAEALVGTGMIAMGETFGDEQPEDFAAVTEDLLALVAEHEGMGLEEYSEESAREYIDELTYYLDIMLQYVEIDPDAVADQLVEGAVEGMEAEEEAAEGDPDALVSDEVWNVLSQNAQAMAQMVQIFEAIGIPAEGEEALNAAYELIPAIADYDQTNLTEGDAVAILDQVNQINEVLIQFVPEE